MRPSNELNERNNLQLYAENITQHFINILLSQMNIFQIIHTALSLCDPVSPKRNIFRRSTITCSMGSHISLSSSVFLLCCHAKTYKGQSAKIRFTN